MLATPRTRDQIASPITELSALVAQRDGSDPLLDLSQGVPNYPTADVIARRMAEVALSADGNRYTERPGLPRLRELIAEEISREYAAEIVADEVLVTAGCNQAFCVVASALADVGDEVLVVAPYYFNHDMWLRLERITPVYLHTDDTHVPDPREIEQRLTDRTRAIVLVTPGNPTGTTIPSVRLAELADIAASHDMALIVDETYKCFRDGDNQPHDLFDRSDWRDHIVSLHSFSKEFALAGSRVGAAIGGAQFLREALKVLDCVAVCAPRIGQEAVMAGLTEALEWRRERVGEIREKQTKFESLLRSRPGGFDLISAGALYGWVRHPFQGVPSDEVVRRLLLENGVLVLPGTLFTPGDDGHLRFSFANLSLAEIDVLKERLEAAGA